MSKNGLSRNGCFSRKSCSGDVSKRWEDNESPTRAAASTSTGIAQSAGCPADAWLKNHSQKIPKTIGATVQRIINMLYGHIYSVIGILVGKWIDDHSPIASNGPKTTIKHPQETHKQETTRTPPRYRLNSTATPSNTSQTQHDTTLQRHAHPNAAETQRHKKDWDTPGRRQDITDTMPLTRHHYTKT